MWRRLGSIRKRWSSQAAVVCILWTISCVGDKLNRSPLCILVRTNLLITDYRVTPWVTIVAYMRFSNSRYLANAQLIIPPYRYVLASTGMSTTRMVTNAGELYRHRCVCQWVTCEYMCVCVYVHACVWVITSLKWWCTGHMVRWCLPKWTPAQRWHVFLLPDKLSSKKGI